MYGKQLKLERITRGYTQEEIAKIANVTQAQISFYENDTNIPSVDICAKIADFYGISIDELIGREINSNVNIDQRHNNGTINNNF